MLLHTLLNHLLQQICASAGYSQLPVLAQIRVQMLHVASVQEDGWREFVTALLFASEVINPNLLETFF